MPPFVFLAKIKANTIFLGLSPRQDVEFQPRSAIHFPACDSSVVQIWVKALRVLPYSPYFLPDPPPKGLVAQMGGGKVIVHI